MANDPRDRRTKNKLIMGCRIPIDIDERENEGRREVFGKVLNERQQKASTRLSNRIMVRHNNKIINMIRRKRRKMKIIIIIK